MTFANDNNQTLDFDGDFALSKQAISFFDFTIKGDVSINFSLSNNAVNRGILGYYGPMIANKSYFISKPFNLIKSGNIISKGMIVIQRDLGDVLDCYFVAGNANWFALLQFNCKTLVNSKYTLTWTSANVNGQKAATEGIVFPIIDYFFSGQKYSQYFQRGMLSGGADYTATKFKDIYPCLYLHTLVEEIATQSGIKIVGTATTDPLYKSLILTVGGPDLVEPSTGAALDPVATTVTLTLGSVAPDMKAIDVIKWIVISFGVVPTFDIYSQTLTLDKSQNKKFEDAEDWSEYFSNYKVEYDKISQHNYVKIKQGQETGLINYNQVNNIVKYGELDIQSTKDDGSNKDLYSSPFTSVKDVIGTTTLQWGTPDAQFFKLTDGTGYAYTSVTNNAGKVEFVGTFPFGVGQAPAVGIIVRADGTVYNGYHTADFVNGGNALRLDADSDYVSNDTGFLYIQTISKQNPGPRVLIYVPSFDVSKFSSKSSFIIDATTTSTIGYAYFSKVTGFAGDPLTKALNYGDISLSNYGGITLDESFYSVVRKAVTSPYVRSRMFLPLSKFANYNGNQIIFLKCEDITGYFFVESILNYQNSSTEVEVNLYFLNG